MATETLIPLESNPDVMNKFLQKLGVPTKWGIVDVMGLEPEMLTWVPKPVVAVTLLFPISEAYEQHKKKEESEILTKGQEVSANLFYMKQNISNACGTIALVHAVANNGDKIELSEGHLQKFLEEAKGLDAAGRGKLLESFEGIINAHKELAQEGQTNTPSADEPVNHHFITFVHKDGALYELDGRKPFPINHGSTTADSLLEDASKICKEFMARDPEEVRFTVVALAASDSD
ncbi:ubiquitin carboxyl-terminal hydrolase isozyme L3 [Bicyclus anynana]|uniref:Ubiquitin carboxyl-terminal hydrolase n=1 Tax=Bicyclus anynana TaxID=110368 RepID=A0A6J1NW81_BICAN|nr:ubiquitin carboxyl-terminal hydrolase isozyme L3 [Bicyclus anynana]